MAADRTDTLPLSNVFDKAKSLRPSVYDLSQWASFPCSLMPAPCARSTTESRVIGHRGPQIRTLASELGQHPPRRCWPDLQLGRELPLVLLGRFPMLSEQPAKQGGPGREARASFLWGASVGGLGGYADLGGRNASVGRYSG
jgi:hypothetical protein